MKQHKVQYPVLIMAFILCIGVIGCSTNTEKISTDTSLGYQISVAIPNGKDYQFSTRATMSSEYEPYDTDAILELEDAILYFVVSDYASYATSIAYQKEHPEIDKNNPNFCQYIDVVFPCCQRIKVNGRKAVKILDGRCYKYHIDINDPKNKLYLVVLPKDSKADPKEVIEETEVQAIIDSIAVQKGEA